MRSGRRRHARDGHALLGASVGVLVTVVLVAVAVHVGALLVARSRAATAADHGALAAASARGDPVAGLAPRAAAERVVHAMGARIRRCDCDTLPILVVVEVDVSMPLGDVAGAIVTVEATGRAGLVPAPSTHP